VASSSYEQLGDDVDGMVAVGSNVRERAAGLARSGGCTELLICSGLEILVVPTILVGMIARSLRGGPVN
jgi:hypothetical protein